MTNSFGLCHFYNTVDVANLVNIFSVNIGTFDILKYLFEQYAKSPKDRNMVNNTGNTILHLACIFPTENSIRDIAVKVALSHGVDPFVRNRSKKMAVDSFIIGTNPTKKMLQSEMKRRTEAGNDKWT